MRTTMMMAVGMSITCSNPLSDKHIAFTTPPNYADRLAYLLQLKGCKPFWCPTVIVEPSSQTKSSMKPYLSALEDYSAIAFTSRTGISAFSETLTEIQNPPLKQTGQIFTISALGIDAELLNEHLVFKICANPERIRVLIPPIASPTSMIESLGLGRGRRILCPVPAVIGVEEPPVIPNFIRGLAWNGWVPVRVSAYETRWAGPRCAESLVTRKESLDAIVFTSTGEVEGLLKSLRELGFDWGMAKERWPGLIVAAHGPVTASGAERLGVRVDVVSRRFESFIGVVEALSLKWG